MADIGQAAQEVRLPRRRNRNPGVQSGGWPVARQAVRAASPASAVARRADPDRRSPKCPWPAILHGPDRQSAPATIADLFNDEDGEVHPLLIARPAGIGAGPAVSPCPNKGSAKTVMRTQAVMPATTAPMTANTSRQASEGTPICATPSVA